MALMISSLSAVGSGVIALRSLAEGDDHRQQAVVARQALLVELGEVGVDRVDVLAQAFPLGLEAPRGVERPDDQRPPLLEPPEDLGGDAIDGPLDPADVLGAVALDRDGLTEHRGRRHRHARSPGGRRPRPAPSPPVVAVLLLEADTAASGGLDTIVARLGENEPAAGVSAGGSALWSRSWKSLCVSSLETTLSTTWLWISRRPSVCTA